MTTESPIVSVIIPVYNAEDFLPECLKALEEQTLKGFEAIFIDDGSSDGSLKLLQKAALQDERFRVFSEEHKNAGAARNRGLKEARGKYISFLDADDGYDPSLLKKASELLDATGADIAVYHFKELSPDGAMSLRRKFPVEEEAGKQFARHMKPEEALLFGGASVWNKMYRADIIRQNNLRFDEISIYNDLTFVVRANLAAGKIACLNDWLYTYKYNWANSISERRGDNYPLIRDALDSLILQERQADPSVIAIAKAHFLIKTLLMDVGNYHTDQARGFFMYCRRYLRETNFDRRKVAAAYPQLNTMIQVFRMLDIRMLRLMDRLGMMRTIKRYIHGRREWKQ